MSDHAGIYRASVADINDPESRGRIRLLVPAVLGAALSAWAEPVLPPTEQIFWTVGDKVWALFEDGDLNRPVYMSRMAVQSEDIVPGAIQPGALGGTGEPPEETTTPIIKPLGYSGVQITWDAISNPNEFTKYRVLFDSVSPPMQELAVTASTIVATSILPDGTQLDPNGVYYAQIIPTDLDGDGNRGGIAEGGPVVVPPDAVAEDVMVANTLFSRAGYFGQVSADQMETGDLTATLVVVGSGGLTIGGIVITADGGIVVKTPLGETIIPSNGSNISLAAGVTANSLVVLGRLAVRGKDNEISKGASVSVENGSTPPREGPQVTSGYPVRDIHGGFNPRGFVYYPLVDRYLHTESVGEGSLTASTLNPVTGNYDYAFESWNITTVRPEVIGLTGGVTVIGDSVYVLGTVRDDTYPNTYNARWYVYQLEYRAPLEQNPTLNRYRVVRRWRYEPHPTLGAMSPQDPSIGTDGTNILIAQMNTSNNWYITRYTPTGSQVGYDALLQSNGTTQFNAERSASGVFISPADLGSSRLWLTHANSTQVYAFTPSGVRTPNDEFTVPMTPNQGLLWDGVRFRSRDADHVYLHSKIKDTDLVSNPVNAVQTWRRADPTDSVTATVGDFAKYETAASPRTQATTLKKRAWVTLRSPAPVPVDPDDPTGSADSLTFYLTRGAGTPLLTAYMRVLPDTSPEAGGMMVTLDAFPTAGGPPPPTTFFGSANPGRIFSSALFPDLSGPVWEVKGDGSGHVGPWAWTATGANANDSGWINCVLASGIATPTASPFNVQIRVRKDGKKVSSLGWAQRVGGAAFTASAITDMATVPAGFLPGNLVDKETSGHTADTHARMLVSTAGLMQIVTSANPPLRVSLSAEWWTD
jgi:hypothetical protein